MQDLLRTFALASFNLQRRKQVEIRMRRALNRLQSIAKQAVLFVQELGRGSAHFPKHRLVAVSDSKEVGILIPRKLQNHFVRSHKSQRWAMCQIADAVMVSIHTNVTKGEEVLAHFRSTMEDITKTLEAWTREGRKWRWLFVGIDLNAQVRKNVHKLTGEALLKFYEEQRNEKRASTAVHRLVH